MEIFLITLLTLSSLNTSINLNLKKDVSFYKLHRQAVASYYDSTRWADDNSFIQVGHYENVLSTSFKEQLYFNSYLKIDFPLVHNISKFDLVLTKASGNLDHILISYYFDDIDFSTTEIKSSGSLPLYNDADILNINLINVANTAIDKGNNYFYIRLSQSYSDGYSEFYYKDEDDNLNPKIIIETNQLPKSDTYGAASDYIRYYPSSSNFELFKRNCYGNAFNLNDDSSGYYIPNGYSEFIRNKEYSNDLLYKMADLVIDDAYNNHQIYSRRIDSYDSPIFEFEYRVAMRLRYNENNLVQDFHFLKQTSTWSWDSKFPTDVNDEYVNFNPTLDEWNMKHNYNSDTVYFAVSI